MDQNTKSNLLTFYRTLQIQIKQSNNDFKFFDDLTFKAKNLYNLALYHERQLYINNNQIITQFQLYKLLSKTQAHQDLPAQSASELYQSVHNTMKSFIQASKQYTKNPNKFLGKPKIPKYKHKTKGRYILTFNRQQLLFNTSNLNFNIILLPKKRTNNHEIKIPKHINIDSIQSLRIVPRNQRIILEIVYTKTIEQPINTNLKYLAAIDLGLDNFAAISIFGPNKTPILLNGKGLKSYNQNFNRHLRHLQSRAKKENNLHTTKRIQNLYIKRQNYINNWMHKASKFTVEYLLENQVAAVAIGHNKSQKQNMNLGHQNNQSFVQIPYQTFINQLIYKAQEAGIQVYITEESYTSGTSFLDNEPPTKDFYSIQRRIHRGLFRSNQNEFINSDTNAAYQILKKAFPNVQTYVEDHGIAGCNTHPMKVTLDPKSKS